MSDRALVAAIRPNVQASSTTGVKKSAVTTTAMAGLTRTTAPSSPCSTPTIRSVPGPSGTSLAMVSSSSPGGILQAQPPPRAYWVSRKAAGPVMRSNVVPRPDTLLVTRPGVLGGADGGRRPGAGSLGCGGVRVPGGPPGLQNRWTARRVVGGFDSRPPPRGLGSPANGRRLRRRRVAIVDPRRQVPRTDVVLADPRLVAARELLGGALVKAAVARAQDLARSGAISPASVADAAAASLPPTAATL